MVWGSDGGAGSTPTSLNKMVCGGQLDAVYSQGPLWEEVGVVIGNTAVAGGVDKVSVDMTKMAFGLYYYRVLSK